MVFVRRRFYYWLIKAYIKRWGRTITLSVIFGCILFFGLLLLYSSYFQPILDRKVIKIGLAGNYKLDTIPDSILNDISFGLTKTEKNGEVSSGAAEKWDISENGKKYIFYLKKGLYFDNNEELTSYNIPYNFSDVKKIPISAYSISFELKSPYSPFLKTVSKHLFLNGFKGLGNFKLSSYELNGKFIKSLTIQNKKNESEKKIYYFYPTEDALKIAIMLGEVDKAWGLGNLQRKNDDLNSWKNFLHNKYTNYNKLVTIFYDTKDKHLSSKKIRQALNFSLTENFLQGERAYSPIPPNSIFFSKSPNYGIVDKELAKSILASSGENPKDIKLEITTTKDFEFTAQQIVRQWNQIGVNPLIKIVKDVPTSFQIFLYEFKIPKDPDQYTVWHSGQKNNIISYKSDRIDKLLENGRTITNQSERVKVYADFQKYLLDDSPASFLYFPYEYSIERK